MLCFCFELLVVCKNEPPEKSEQVMTMFQRVFVGCKAGILC
jgi:hypothetical protein